MATMTRNLKAVFEQLSQLPEEEQDRYAEIFREAMLTELRRLIQEGLESGPAEVWSKEAFLAEAHARWEGRKQKQA